MKWIKIIGHPILLISLFLLLLIEGDHFGGFYLLYLLLSLPEGAPYAILALLGLILVLTGYKIYGKPDSLLKPILYIAGLLVMMASLYSFFQYGDKSATFELTIPLLTFILFSISCICFLINTVFLLFHLKQNRLRQ